MSNSCNSGACAYEKLGIAWEERDGRRVAIWVSQLPHDEAGKLVKWCACGDSFHGDGDLCGVCWDLENGMFDVGLPAQHAEVTATSSDMSSPYN